MRSLLLLCIAFLAGCGDPPRQSVPFEPSQAQPSEAGVKDQLIRANKQLLQKETDEINYYIRSRKMPFVSTSSGVRYYVYQRAETGDSIRPQMQISMDYTVSLLDGTVCYSSATDGRRSFVVEHEHIESGIHRGVQYLKRGDQALLIIPSPLAHGLLGDSKKIPPQVPILYNVHIF